MGLLAIWMGAFSEIRAASPLLTPIARAGTAWPVAIAAMTQDTSGYTYVTGSRLVEGISSDTPGYAKALTYVFAARFDPSGAPVYMISFGGKQSDAGLGIAADAQGNAFVVGATTSPDFPLKNPVQSRAPQAGGAAQRTGFVTKLSPTGDLIFSTYFGGAGTVLNGSEVTAVAVDAGGSAYVTGQTDSESLTVTPGAFQQSGVAHPSFPGSQVAAFVAKFAPRGTLTYSTYLGGHLARCGGGLSCSGATKSDSGTAIAVTAAGEAYILGQTNATDFPVTAGAYQPTCACPLFLTVPFLAKMNPAGSGLVFATLLSGPVNSNERTPVALSLATDSAGNALVGGSAFNAGFPTTAGVLQQSIKGGWDGFLTKFSATGALAFSTFLGGDGTEAISSIAINASGNIYIAGKTDSSIFPDSTAIFVSGANFAAELDASASKLLNSMRLPGGVSDVGITSGGVVAGSSGVISRINFAGAAQPTVLGLGNAALHGLGAASAGSVISIYAIGIGGSGLQVMFQDGQNTYLLPLLYASPAQINAILPLGVVNGSVSVALNGTTVGRFDVALQEVSPQVFRNADGTALAVNQDGALNSAANPATSGDVVSVWGTGVPSNDPPQNIAQQACPLGFPLLVDGATPVYWGCAPGAPEAVFQVNFRVRFQGPQQHILSVNGVASEPFTVYVKFP